MIVNDFHVVGVFVFPLEADPTLLVDPNAVLAPPIAVKLLQPVLGRVRSRKQVAASSCLNRRRTCLATPRSAFEGRSSLYKDRLDRRDPGALSDERRSEDLRSVFLIQAFVESAMFPFPIR